MFDHITAQELRERGSVKWSAFPETIGAFIAEMDFGTAPEVSEAIARATRLHQFGYLPEHLKAALGRAYADFAADRYGARIDPKFVRPVLDVVEGLIAVVDHFTTPGTPVLVPTPAYMPFLTLGPVINRPIIEVPLARDGGRYVYDAEALAAAFTTPGQLLILCNPHNPIGRVLEREELTEISRVVEEAGGLVFSDEIHAPLTFPGHRHLPYAAVNEVSAGHTITATSASKAWNIPGLKAAQLIFSNPDHYRTWAAVARRYEQGASTLGVHAAIAAYTAGSPWLGDVLAYLDTNRRLLSDLLPAHLPGVGYTEPEGTYLAWLDARDLALPGRAADFFRAHAQVATTPGEECGAPGYLRLNFATPTPILVRAVEAMGAAVMHK